MKQNRKWTVLQISTIGVFAALVFLMNFIQIPVALSVGNTRIHLGNVMCLLSGFVLGPVGGGLAAGIGSGLYDLMMGDFIYIPFYFVFKFLLAFCGALAANIFRRGVKPIAAYALGGFCGQICYIVLHLACKTFFFNMILYKMAEEAILLDLAKATVISAINGALAVVISTILALALAPVYEKMRDQSAKSAEPEE